MGNRQLLGLSVLPEKGIDLSFDAPLYMMNTQAMAMAKEMNASRVTLSVEDRFENLRKLVKEASLPGNTGCLSGSGIVYQCGLYSQ